MRKIIAIVTILTAAFTATIGIANAAPKPAPPTVQTPFKPIHNGGGPSGSKPILNNTCVTVDVGWTPEGEFDSFPPSFNVSHPISIFDPKVMILYGEFSTYLGPLAIGWVTFGGNQSGEIYHGGANILIYVNQNALDPSTFFSC